MDTLALQVCREGGLCTSTWHTCEFLWGGCLGVELWLHGSPPVQFTASSTLRTACHSGGGEEAHWLLSLVYLVAGEVLHLCTQCWSLRFALWSLTISAGSPSWHSGDAGVRPSGVTFHQRAGHSSFEPLISLSGIPEHCSAAHLAPDKA